MIADVIREFRRHQRLADEALGQMDDAMFFHQPGARVNPMALIVKHVAGNLRSRWSDFLTTDGEKPDRNREGEFQRLPTDTRDSLAEAWKRGWDVLYASLESLSEADLERIITIRGEPHTVRQAVLRSLTHTAYHVGQILYLARLLRPDGAWLTIPPGDSETYSAHYLRPSSTG